MGSKDSRSIGLAPWPDSLGKAMHNVQWHPLRTLHRLLLPWLLVLFEPYTPCLPTSVGCIENNLDPTSSRYWQILASTCMLNNKPENQMSVNVLAEVCAALGRRSISGGAPGHWSVECFLPRRHPDTRGPLVLPV